MPVSLAESKNNTQDDYNPAVIDEFRKESVILDSLIFDDAVNPSGGGNTLTYGYRRLVSQPTASFRAINSEYTPANVVTQKFSVDLAPLGGSFEVDRVVSKIGPAASGAVTLNLAQKIKATRTRFQDAVINGDVEGAGSDDANGFDGLDKALRGSTTEYNPTTVTDWSGVTSTDDSAFGALDKLDEFLSLLDGTPTVVIGNTKALAKVRAIVRRTSMYTRDPVDGLLGVNGRPITREVYGGVLFADPGDKAGTSSPIIPVQTRNTKWKVTITAGAGGDTFALSVGGSKTGALAYNVSNADLKTALEALSTVAAGDVTVSGSAGTYNITFGSQAANVTLDDSGMTTGTAALVTDSGTGNTGLTDLYVYRVGLDGFHGVSVVGGQLVQTWLPDFSQAGAVKKGEVELGPVAVALKATKAAAVFRNIKVQ